MSGFRNPANSKEKQDASKIEAARQKEINTYLQSLPDEDDWCDGHQMKYKYCVRCNDKMFDNLDGINEKYDEMYQKK